MTVSDDPRCGCDGRRRATLRCLAGLAAGALGLHTPAGAQGADIVQPRQPGPAGFAERAFEMRRISVERGDQAYGAVVVRDGRIVGEGISAVLTHRDPTAHAERQAMRDAARRLGTPDLSGSELYGTSRACPMCEAAAFRAHISRMYYGAAAADAGAPALR
jgi:tRNA(Arg) A34 adenosine deaminase TadA